MSIDWFSRSEKYQLKENLNVNDNSVKFPILGCSVSKSSRFLAWTDETLIEHDKISEYWDGTRWGGRFKWNYPDLTTLPLWHHILQKPQASFYAMPKDFPVTLTQMDVKSY